MKRSGFGSAITIILTLFVIIGFVTLSIVGLTGCSVDDNSVSFNSTGIDTTASYKADRLADIEENHLFVITDDKTGVQYIIYSEIFYRGGAGGITPRYNTDGTLYIDPNWKGKASEE